MIAMPFTTSGLAQTACETQAVDKDGKPLSGTAKTAFIKRRVDSYMSDAMSASGGKTEMICST
jgi:hypothetical protein